MSLIYPRVRHWTYTPVRSAHFFLNIVLISGVEAFFKVPAFQFIILLHLFSSVYETHTYISSLERSINKVIKGRVHANLWIKSQLYLVFLNQFSSVAQLCLTLWDPMDCSMPDFPVHHQLLEFAQTLVHWVDDAIQPPHPLSSPSPPAFNLSQHQGLFQ